MNIENFWENVDVKSDSECWEWKRCKSKNGYGFVRFESKTTLAHILSYRLTHDDYDNSLYICHKCNNPSCCNPAHLYMGTQQQNMRDVQDRYKRGELKYKRTDNGVVKKYFTTQNVDDMIHMYQLGIRTIEIAALMKTSSVRVREILVSKGYR